MANCAFFTKIPSKIGAKGLDDFGFFAGKAAMVEESILPSTVQTFTQVFGQIK